MHFKKPVKEVFKKNMKIIITGAAGFIGSNLVKKLAEDSAHEIFGVSRNQLGYQGITWVNADLSDPAWSDQLPGNADVVIHLAQSKRYREFPDGAPDMVRININSTAELLEWSRTHGVKKFIFASTGNVYQRTENKLLKETDICVPDSMYSATKLSAEYIVQQYSSFFQTITLRIFGVYGQGQKDMLVPRLTANIRAGNPIALDGGDGLSLSPIYIDDCVQFIKCLLESSIENHAVFNLAGSEVLTLRQITEEISQVIGTVLNPQYTNTTPQFFAADISKIINVTGYMPATDFKKGIAITTAKL